MVNIKHSILLIIVAAVITITLRFLPFILFRDQTKMPKWLKRVADVIPPAIMAVLVLYCLKDSVFKYNGTLVASLISLLVVILLHLWKRNTLLSIAVGTVIFMVLVHVLPDNVFHLPETVTATTTSTISDTTETSQTDTASKTLSVSEQNTQDEVKEYSYFSTTLDQFSKLTAADLEMVKNPMEWELYSLESAVGTLYIVDESSDHSATLYGMYGEYDKLLLRDKDNVYVLEDMPICIPRSYQPNVERADYDGDGEYEYAIDHIVGSGTGVQMVSLCIIKPTKNGYDRFETDITALGKEIASHYVLEDIDGTMGELYRDGVYEGMMIYPDWVKTDVTFYVGDIIECIPRKDGLWLTASGGIVQDGSYTPVYDPEVLITAPLSFKNGTFIMGKLNTEISNFYYDDEGQDVANGLTKREICEAKADFTQDGVDDIVKVYIKQDDASKNQSDYELLQSGFQGKVCLYDGDSWDAGKFSFKNYYFGLPYEDNIQMSIVEHDGMEYLLVSQLIDTQGYIDFSYRIFSVTGSRNELCIASNRLSFQYADYTGLSDSELKKVQAFLEEILKYTDGSKKDSPAKMLFRVDVTMEPEYEAGETNKLLPASEYYKNKIDAYKSGNKKGKG